MANIPDNILDLCILSKLPVKSLIRFKCVSKSWYTLITSPYFIRLYHRHALSSDKNRHLICTRPLPSEYFDVYNLDSPCDPPSKCSYPKLKDVRAPVIIASCEFFLLLLVLDELVLFNPSTHSYHEIPCQNLTSYVNSLVKYGVCFDEANDDYNVIRITCYFDDQNRNTMDIMIYSFKTNLWRLIERKLTSDVFYDYSYASKGSNDVFVVNNLLYTILKSTNAHIKKRVTIGCFDMKTEQWTNDIPLAENDFSYYRIQQLDGSICVVGHGKRIHGGHCVWVMKDGCWVKLMSIADSSWWHYNIEYHPITYRTGSRVEILCARKGRNSLCGYNLRGERLGDFAGGYEYHMAHVCKGSLVTFANALPLLNQG